MSRLMQPFLTVRDLLRSVAALHLRCHRRLATAALVSNDLRLRVLLAFLGAREAEQFRAITRLRTGDSEALGCFVQGVPATTFATARSEASPIGDCEQIMDSYLRREQALEQCFRQLMDVVGPRAESLFGGLLVMKQQNQARLREASLDF